jgi:hypothetical protein
MRLLRYLLQGNEFFQEPVGFGVMVFGDAGVGVGVSVGTGVGVLGDVGAGVGVGVSVGVDVDEPLNVILGLLLFGSVTVNPLVVS